MVADDVSDDISIPANTGAGPNAGMSLNIQKFEKRGKNKSKRPYIGYFLDVHGLQQAVVNLQKLGTRTISGPLPDFSVIEIGAAVIFWWRSKAALKKANKIMVRFARE